MKFAICVIATFFAATQAIPLLEDADQYREICIQETGIDASKIPTKPQGPPPQSQGQGQGPPPEPGQDMKCFMNCVMEKSSMINSAGELQTDKVPLPSGATGVNLESCKSVSETDKCERAWQISKCIMKQLPHQH